MRPRLSLGVRRRIDAIDMIDAIDAIDKIEGIDRY